VGIRFPWGGAFLFTRYCQCIYWWAFPFKMSVLLAADISWHLVMHCIAGFMICFYRMLCVTVCSAFTVGSAFTVPWRSFIACSIGLHSRPEWASCHSVSVNGVCVLLVMRPSKTQSKNNQSKCKRHAQPISLAFHFFFSWGLRLLIGSAFRFQGL
jgi:hypothetical protein